MVCHLQLLNAQPMPPIFAAFWHPRFPLAISLYLICPLTETNSYQGNRTMDTSSKQRLDTGKRIKPAGLKEWRLWTGAKQIENFWWQMQFSMWNLRIEPRAGFKEVTVDLPMEVPTCTTSNSQCGLNQQTPVMETGAGTEEEIPNWNCRLKQGLRTGTLLLDSCQSRLPH